MSFIKGIGDEVVIVGLLLLLLFIISLIYLSFGFTFDSITTYLSDWRFRRREATDILQDNETVNIENNQMNDTEEQNVDATAMEQSDSSSSDSHDETATTQDEQDCETEKSCDADAQMTSTSEQNVIRSEVPEPISDAESASFVASTKPEEECKSSQSKQIPVTVPGDLHSPQRERTNNNNTLPPNVLEVRLKYLNDTERIVRTEISMKIIDFKRTNFAEDIANRKVVKLIYNGQLLRDNLKMSEYGIASGTVIHVHIANAPSPQAPTNESSADLDLSAYLCPLFGIILGVCWMSCFQYPDYFNVPAIILLVIFTLSFLLFYSRTPMEV